MGVVDKQSPEEALKYVSDMLLELQKIARPHSDLLAYLIEVAYLEARPTTETSKAKRTVAA
jgi:hypothetical protein